MESTTLYAWIKTARIANDKDADKRGMHQVQTKGKDDVHVRRGEEGI